MSNQTTNPAPASVKAQARPPQGFAPKSVTVFALGLSGLLVPLLGLIPSVMAIGKARGAKDEIARSRGYFRGYGLIRWGLILGWLGVLGSLLAAGLVVGAVWALQNMPSLLTSVLGVPTGASAFDPTAMLSILDSQDLNAILSDPEVIKDLEQRLRDAGIDPQTLFGPNTGESPAPSPKP